MIIGNPKTIVRKLFPVSLARFRLIFWCGDFLHRLVQWRGQRRQIFSTFFFRNRPQLELIRRLVTVRPLGSVFSLLVMACSNGAEVYSIMWTIRSERNDIKVTVHAMDISEEIVKTAREGIYRTGARELVTTNILERATHEELRALFEVDGDVARIKTWIKEGIQWKVADANDPDLRNQIGLQDLVVANNFLCHMDPSNAERCLRNLARLVKPAGYLLVSGVDLDVRTKVALDLGWTPVRDLLEEMHDGDSAICTRWPWDYCGLEPLTKRRSDWEIRYASAFRIQNGPNGGVARS